MGRPRTFWLATLPPTLYLWATDLFAIHAGIWSISPRYTLGWNLFGVLPAEEMAFFFITNLLIATGLLAFLHPVALDRVNVLRRVFRPWQGLLLLYALLKIPVPLWPGGFALLGTLSTGALFLAGLSLGLGEDRRDGRYCWRRWPSGWGWAWKCWAAEPGFRLAATATRAHQA